MFDGFEHLTESPVEFGEAGFTIGRVSEIQVVGKDGGGFRDPRRQSGRMPLVSDLMGDDLVKGAQSVLRPTASRLYQNDGRHGHATGAYIVIFGD